MLLLCQRHEIYSLIDKSSPFQQIQQYGTAVKVFGRQWVTQGHCYVALRGHFDCLRQLTKPALLLPRPSICSSLSPHRSLCPYSPSRPPKPDYCLPIQTQSLLLIRTNLLVIEHTSSLLRPAKTGADLPQTIINLKCLPFLSFPNPCHPSLVAAQLLSRSIELLNGHNQPSGTTRQWILKIHQAANQQASTWQTLLFSYGVTVTLGPPLTLPCYKESESAPLLRLRTNNLLGTFDLLVQHSVTAVWRQPCWERERVCAGIERERVKNRENKSTNFRRTPTAEGKKKKTQEFWEPWTKKRCWLLALIAKGCPYKSLPFPEQPGPSLLWARSYAFNDAL